MILRKTLPGQGERHDSGRRPQISTSLVSILYASPQGTALVPYFLNVVSPAERAPKICGSCRIEYDSQCPSGEKSLWNGLGEGAEESSGVVSHRSSARKRFQFRLEKEHHFVTIGLLPPVDRIFETVSGCRVTPQGIGPRIGPEGLVLVWIVVMGSVPS
jgi:hypothetical protein